ncbi:hypothetical protein ECDEC8A_4383 [Escherichia coli DEC8A]|nr:hypothetical protein ECDEC8A_4383 [Escherichia coli DEC8A]
MTALKKNLLQVHVKILISSDQRSMPVELSIVLLVIYVALH